MKLPNKRKPGSAREGNQFDTRSGSFVERLVFNNRALVLVIAAIATVALSYFASQQSISASFNRVIPASHPYIQNYLANKDQLPGLGNAIRIVVENTNGDIFNADYLDALREANDTVYLIPGTDRSWMRSIWMPIVRYSEVTEEGIAGGPVMPSTYDGSAKSIEKLRENILQGGLVGGLVATDMSSSMIVVPLLETDPATGEPLDYHAYSQALEEKIRSLENDQFKVRIIGFAKLSGDLIDGVSQVMMYFALAAAIVFLLLMFYTHCLRSTLLVMACSFVGVLWQLGLVNLLGYDLNPYSVLVPFLVFAIGVSHAAQIMNQVMRETGQGVVRLLAARFAFRRLYRTGTTALITDAIGFMVLMVIDIPVIQDLAIAASVGVAVLILTNLVLLPTLFSFVGVSPRAAERQSRDSETGFFAWIWKALGLLTQRRYATVVLVCAVALTAVGYYVGLGIKVGDLGAGAPELRPDSRYNRDTAFINERFGLSSDQFAVMVTSEPGQCTSYDNLLAMDQLEWRLRQLDGVSVTQSLAGSVRQVTGGSFEANPKWFTISRDQRITNSSSSSAMLGDPALTNNACSVTPLIAYLQDHKAETLSRVLNEVETFAEEYNTDDIQFLPAAGSAGIEAVTNIVVDKANSTMLYLVYGAVILLCWIAFRSVKAVIVAVLPLVMTSILCQALMVILGIGVKVSTLPVIALGVGIGIDYALYLLSTQLNWQRAGCTLAEAYARTLRSTGKVVALIGFTLGASVLTWAFSPIQFQADMGVLLTFMFLWNMLAALVLIPVLSSFLLNDVKAVQSAISDGDECEQDEKRSKGSPGQSQAAVEPSVSAV